MRATAAIEAVPDGRGGTRLAMLRDEPPLLLRRTGPSTVHLVGGAAGPLGGDRVTLSIRVGPGAVLRIRSAAASVALPGSGTSTLDIMVVVGAGGTLDWQPEPLIAARSCDHAVSSTVELDEGASLVWRDELVCGRHGEPPGDAVLATSVSLGGQPLYVHQLAVGPSAPGWDSPFVLGGGRAVGSLLVVDPSFAGGAGPATRSLGPAAAVMALAGPAVLVQAVGTDLREVRRLLAAGC